MNNKILIADALTVDTTDPRFVRLAQMLGFATRELESVIEQMMDREQYTFQDALTELLEDQMEVRSE